MDEDDVDEDESESESEPAAAAPVGTILGITGRASLLPSGCTAEESCDMADRGEFLGLVVAKFMSLRFAARFAVVGALVSLIHGISVLHSLPSPNQTWIEPYPYLSGGQFVGQPLPFTADPLSNYVWATDVNASQLQVVFVLPTSASLVTGTPVSSFVGYDSITLPGASVTVSGPGSLQLYFNVELAGWLEFDSPDLLPADAALITMSSSEYNQPEITNLGFKTAVPVAYPRGDGNTTYRLETNPGLYEGIRFGWLALNSTPSAPWHITAFRCVAQVKPTNWGGAFAAAGDDMLSKIWYAAAYTVKANLLSDQIGAVRFVALLWLLSSSAHRCCELWAASVGSQAG